MQLLEALAKGLTQMEADGRSPLTLGQYRRHIGLLDRWLVANRRPRDVEVLGHETLASFLVDDVARRRPDGRPKTTTSMNALRTSLRAFFGYCHAAGITPGNPARLIRRARCAPPPPRTLSDKDVRRWLAAAQAGSGRAARRDAALLRLLLGTGLRLSSALGLRIEDIDSDRRELRVRRVKGDRPTTLPVSRAVARELRGYVDGRRHGWLFPGEAGGPLTRRQAGRRLALLAEAAGLGGRASAHVARHVFAQRLLDKTGNLRIVQAALGHRSLNSTAVYAGSQDLRAALS